MRTAALLLLAFALAAPAGAVDESVTLKVIPPDGKLKLTEPFTFTVEASLPEGFSLKVDTAAASNAEFETVSFTLTTEKKAGGRKTDTFEIEAKPFTLGISTYPAISWGLRGAGVPEGTVVQSAPFNIEVVPLFKTKEGEDIRDIYPPFSYSRWLLLLALLLALAAAAYYFYKRFGIKAGGTVFARAPWADARNPYQRARDRLDKLLASPLSGQGKLKQHYTGLTAILRFYLAEEFRIDAVLMTTADLGRELKKTGADLKTILRTRELLQKADLVKFAKLIPEGVAADGAAAAEIMMDFHRTAEAARALAAQAAAAADEAARRARGGRA